ncbi:hypothetical protein PHMEG_00022728 [Phytophthora megakarya]|uniref:Uncharacterized protein n=1 Tax=Phytophthora megakarya TaxID=4795 RepID=A0A225VIR9_9STRA|nr:hypothetical protein PHMEG_00022728 [Phytophthora megakarya]
MQHLDFPDNKSPAAKIDRVWKIRPIVDTLQQTFGTKLFLRYYPSTSYCIK